MNYVDEENKMWIVKRPGLIMFSFFFKVLNNDTKDLFEEWLEEFGFADDLHEPLDKNDLYHRNWSTDDYKPAWLRQIVWQPPRLLT